MYLQLLGQAGFIDIVVQGSRQGAAETGQVGSSILLRDVVGEAENAFLVGLVPLHGHFHHHVVLFRADMEDFFMQGGFLAVQMLDKSTNTAFVFEQVFLAFFPLILQVNPHPGVEKGQLPQAFGKNIVMKFRVREDFPTGLEPDAGASFFRLTNSLEGFLGFSHHITLVPDFSFPLDGQLQLLGESVHHGHADAVQPSGYLVGIVIEFAAGMEHGHDDFGRGNPFFLVKAHRNAAAIIGNRDGIVRVNGDIDGAAMASQGLVDGIVHDLEDHVMQAGAIIGVAYIHARTLAHRVQALEHLDGRGIVIVVVSHGVCASGKSG